jgi:hypothetical protein
MELGSKKQVRIKVRGFKGEVQSKALCSKYGAGSKE